MSDYTKLRREDVVLSIDIEKLKAYSDYTGDIEIIGQPRALKALTLGTEIRSRGYNIFVSGGSGTGRTTAIRAILKDCTPDEKGFKDIAVVCNFKRPDNPKVLYFPPGKARDFKARIHSLVETLKIILKGRLESDMYKHKRDKLVSLIEKEENHRLNEFEARLKDQGFAIIRIEDEGTLSTDIFPLYNNELTDFDKLQSLVVEGTISEQEWNRLREDYYRHIDEMKTIYSQLKLSRTAMEEDLKALKVETVKPSLAEEMEPIRKAFDTDIVLDYLDAMEQDLLDHMDFFTQDDTDEGEAHFLQRYGMNILVDHSDNGHVPVVFENHPTTANLIGTIGYHFDLGGESKTTFMDITAGSLIRCSGGYIVIKAEDLLQEEDAWPQLKRVLQTGKVEIQGTGGPLGFPGPSIKPEPVEIAVKVLLVGGENLYEILYATDVDFQKYFKVSAEFDSVMDLSPQAKTRYIDFIRRKTKEDGLKDVSWDGIAEVIKYGIHLAEQRDKISTRFSLVSDILTESDYWAKKAGHAEIGSGDVRKAIEERNYLFNLPEEKTEEMIIQGDLLIPLSGSAVGQVNGLAIHDRGYYSYGSPTQISARIAPGEEGIVNIEREVGLSGEIHDKWVMILAGFLRSRYGSNFPVSIFASICFEQSYSEIDGDSASSTELYALLSAIADQPLRQDIAVTGSVNQAGQVQPVGGISEKITGFYNICAKTGLTGSQGVIVPMSNSKNIILSSEIGDAIADGWFTIYPVETIDEGMAILTGVEMGEANADGSFPKNSLNWHIERRLRDIATQVKKFSG